MSDRLTNIRVRAWTTGTHNTVTPIINLRTGLGAQLVNTASGGVFTVLEGLIREDMTFLSVVGDAVNVTRSGMPQSFGDGAEVFVFNDYSLPDDATGQLALVSQVDAVQASVDSTQAEVDALEIVVSGQGVDIADHEVRITALEGDVADHETRIGDLESDVSTIQITLGDSESGLDVIPFFYRGNFGYSHVTGGGRDDFGLTTSLVGTAGTVTAAVGDQVSGVTRNTGNTNTTANQIGGTRVLNTNAYRGSSPGLGGLRLYMRVVGPHGPGNIDADPSFHRRYCGWVASATSTLISTVNPSTLLNVFGFGWDDTFAAGSNWQLIHNDGSGAATVVDTGIARNSNNLYDIRLWADANESVMYARITDLVTLGTYAATVSTNLPDPNTYLEFGQYIANVATATALGAQYVYMRYSTGPFI